MVDSGTALETRPMDATAVPADMDAIVLGAGITGLVAARLLRLKGARRVVLLDRYAAPGGNHIDRRIGPYTFDIGTIIFQDDSPLLRHFPELLPFYRPVEPSISRVSPGGAVRAYPVDVGAELVARGPVEWARIGSSLAWGRVRHRRMRHAGDYIRFWIGARLAHLTGIESYVERFYGEAPAAIDLSFARKRMLWIAENASLRAQVARRLRRPAVWAGGRSYVRPTEGFAPLYAAAADRLRAEGVTLALAQDLRAIRRDGDHVVVETADGAWRAPEVVSTIPLADALGLAGLSSRLPAPPSVDLLTLFFSFRGERGFRTPILYNFAHEGHWKRITVHSDFHGEAGGRAYFGVEINRRPGTAATEAVLAADEAAAFRRDVEAKGLFRGDLVLEGSHLLANAYPAYRHGAAAQAEAAIAALRSLGVRSFGRQGGFDYLPTARHATLVAETAILGAPGPLDDAPDHRLAAAGDGPRGVT